jgi:ribonuclease BN (tRNA processing enzyme)
MDSDVLKFAQKQEQQMIDFIRDADVLIIDSQYDREEYPRHMGWGHGCLDHVVNLAMRAEVKKLFLFHHDPSHDDKKISDMVGYARKLVKEAKSFVQVDAAQEGLIVELTSEKSSGAKPPKRKA